MYTQCSFLSHGIDQRNRITWSKSGRFYGPTGLEGTGTGTEREQGFEIVTGWDGNGGTGEHGFKSVTGRDWKAGTGVRNCHGTARERGNRGLKSSRDGTGMGISSWNGTGIYGTMNKCSPKRNGNLLRKCKEGQGDQRHKRRGQNPKLYVSPIRRVPFQVHHCTFTQYTILRKKSIFGRETVNMMLQ